ncbi:MAG TPA: CHAT domain-containing tetratricopeptide repeat protein [Candidatus Eisenbacteria bacterium]|nr:CHAT domain-containing tetratricopeptide repeat protein [Candidatus Eisenbacteria bacterium]
MPGNLPKHRYRGWIAFAIVAIGIASHAEASSPSPARDVREEVQAGRYALAESLAWDAVATVGRARPVDSLRFAAALEAAAYASLYNGTNRRSRALDAVSRAVSICERRADDVGPLLGRCLLTQGRLVEDLDRQDEAVPLLVRARTHGALTDPGGEPDSTRALFELGNALVWTDRDSLGWATLEEARIERVRLLGSDHPALLGSFVAQANRAWLEGRLDSSVAIADRGLDLGRRVLGPSHPMLASLLRRKAANLRFGGRFTDAASAYDEAIRILETALRPNHPELAATYIVAAVNLIRLSEYERVESYFDRAIPIMRAEIGSETLTYARALAAEGEFRAHMGDIARARTLLEESLALHRRLGTKGSALGAALRNLGSVLLWNGWPQEGRTYFEEALKEYESTYPPGHVEIAISKLSMANALHVTEQFDRAEAMAREALAIFEKSRPPVASTGDCLKRIGEIEMSRGHLMQAVGYFEQAMAALQGIEGDGRFWVANALIQRGTAYQYAGKLEEAQRDRELALQALASTYGAGHPQTYLVSHALALVHEERGDRASAFRVATDVLDLQVPYMRRSLWQLPERESLTYSQSLGALVGTITALARDGGLSVPDGPARALDAVIRSRGLVLEETARRLHAMRQSNTPELQRLQSEFVNASRKLASLELRTGPTAATASDVHARHVEDARRERDRIERALGAMDPAYSALVGRDEIRLGDVAAALPPGAVLVSYVTVDRGGFLDARAKFRTMPGNDRIPPPPFGPPRYVAFVLAAGDTVPSLIPLGAKTELDNLVTSWLTEAGSPPPGNAKARQAAERRCRAAGKRLRGAVLDPVLERAPHADYVFIVPDGALCAVSFGALPGKMHEFLAEEPVLLHMLTAERDLVPATGLPAERGAGLLALGGADFDAKRLHQISESTSGVAFKANVSGVYRGPRVPCDKFENVEFVPIWGSQREVDDIALLWKSAENAPHSNDIQVLRGRAASEDAVKTMAPGKRVVHLATHGFILDGACEPSREGERGFGVWAPVGAPTPSVPSSFAKPRRVVLFHSNSLLLSGLALAGANRRSSVGPDEEDGILTAEEIAAMDLSGVEWVVISACESGRGSIRPGEGVVGLRRSFHLAGARTTIMSLWSVEDRATREWMKALYEERLLRGRETAASLRKACRDVLASRRASTRSTHPFYWGAFVAAGDWK